MTRTAPQRAGASAKRSGKHMVRVLGRVDTVGAGGRVCSGVITCRSKQLLVTGNCIAEKMLPFTRSLFVLNSC